jgi:hypothetical protein
MDEKNLKHLFIKYINAGHNDWNYFLSLNPQDPNIEIRIKDEGYHRNFDLLIAVIKKRHSSQVDTNWISAGHAFLNMIMRSNELIQFAQKEKTRIDWITVYLVELKSDNDVLDRRLINQLLNGIQTFGKSILVLDREHSKRLKSKGILSFIPATVIGYNGTSPYQFEILSVFDRFINDGIFSIEKRKVAKILLDNGINPTSSIFNCILNFQRICQKIIFSQLLDQHISLMKEEINFIMRLTDIKPLTTRRLVKSLIKETTNNKITDYF